VWFYTVVHYNINDKEIFYEYIVLLEKIPFITIDTILLCPGYRDIPTVLPLSLGSKHSCDNFLYNVTPDIYSPIKFSNSIVHYTLAEMAFGL
jgi:hypothetical protein